jgi:hypothetical protein
MRQGSRLAEECCCYFVELQINRFSLADNVLQGHGHHGVSLDGNHLADWDGAGKVFERTAENVSTLTAKFDSWNGRYIERVDAAILSATWDGYKLTLQLEAAGGTLKVYCGAYKPKTTGVSASFDKNSGMLSGTPTSKTVILDWNYEVLVIQHGVTFQVYDQDLGTMQQGQASTVQVAFSFSSASFTVTGTQFQGSGSQWFTPATEFPASYTRGAEEYANGTIDVQLAIPEDAELGNHTAQVTVNGVDPYGTDHSATAALKFQVEEKGGGFNMLRNPWVVAALVLITVVIAAVALRTPKRR